MYFCILKQLETNIKEGQRVTLVLKQKLGNAKFKVVSLPVQRYRESYSSHPGAGVVVSVAQM